VLTWKRVKGHRLPVNPSTTDLSMYILHRCTPAAQCTLHIITYHHYKYFLFYMTFYTTQCQRIKCVFIVYIDFIYYLTVIHFIASITFIVYCIISMSVCYECVITICDCFRLLNCSK